MSRRKPRKPPRPIFHEGKRLYRVPDFVKSDGRRYVKIENNQGEWEEKAVCEMVALAFLGPPPEEKPFVLHKDGNIKNDRADNLFYGSQEEKDRLEGSRV